MDHHIDVGPTLAQIASILGLLTQFQRTDEDRGDLQMMEVSGLAERQPALLAIPDEGRFHQAEDAAIAAWDASRDATYGHLDYIANKLIIWAADGGQIPDHLLELFGVVDAITGWPEGSYPAPLPQVIANQLDDSHDFTFTRMREMLQGGFTANRRALMVFEGWFRHFIKLHIRLMCNLQAYEPYEPLQTETSDPPLLLTQRGEYIDRMQCVKLRELFGKCAKHNGGCEACRRNLAAIRVCKFCEDATCIVCEEHKRQRNSCPGPFRWSTKVHKWFPRPEKEKIEFVFLVQNRLRSMAVLPPLPLELWYMITAWWADYFSVDWNVHPPRFPG